MAPERRREAAAARAPSLLLTLLGEFVLPSGQPVWTGALVAALAKAGVEEKAARQALARTAAERLLTSERDGRRVLWHLTPAGTRLLAEGTDRIYGFGRQAAEWDGRWLVLAVSVPESQRRLRHRLRTRLTWAGLGSPLPGLWVTPDTGKEKEVAAAVEELGVEGHTFTGPYGELGDHRRLVAAAWQLEEVEARYTAFLQDHAELSAGTPAEAFRCQLRLVQQWRRFPFLDPALPPALLHATWPGPAAARLFSERHDALHAPAQAHWAALSEDAARRT